MIVTTPPSKGVRPRKRKREVIEPRPSAEEVSEKNLKETAPMFLARQQSTRATRWPGSWLTY